MLPDRIRDPQSGVRGAREAGQLRKADQNRQQQQGNADRGVGHLDRRRLLHAIQLLRVGSKFLELSNGQRHGAQNQQTSKLRRDGGAERIERLRQVHAAGCRFRFA